MTSLVAAGATLAAIGVVGRILIKQAGKTVYYKGGFQPIMTKREAKLILGLNTNTAPDKVKLAHKKIMMVNHPDKGGSPYIAAKINQAKDMLEQNQ